MSTIPESLQLPDETLAHYLQKHIADFQGPLISTKFKGGQSNPTYLLKAASGNYVLRRKPPGKLLASAHAVDREYRVLQSLHSSAVPVAKPFHLCADENIIGSMFYVMEYIDGKVFWDPSLPDCTTAQRAEIFDALIETLAAIHSVSVEDSGLNDYGKPGNYFERQITRWSKQYRDSETQSIAAMDALIEQLPMRCPEDDGSVALVHGDFRIDNLMFNSDGTRILAVVDWELSTLGHPLADLGYFCMALRLPRNPALPGLAGLNRGELGIPEEQQILQRYAELTGRAIPSDWSFVLAFSFFRLAAIAQGVAKRATQGNASSEQAMQAGRMVELLATMGLSELQK
ncbi:MAG TPA: phosphotransferase family protein [Arenimonas sp.]|nr:phosphotransferase family protein [Arenimonas sp.]